MTIGYAPPDPLFIRGRSGHLPSGSDAVLARMFLFGTAVEPFSFKDTFGLRTGQEVANPPIASITLRIEGRAHVFSREVVAACSGPAIDISMVTPMAEALRLLAEKAPDTLGDAAVSLQQILAGLVGLRSCGYAISPPLQLSGRDDFSIEGVPYGMRLFITGTESVPLR